MAERPLFNENVPSFIDTEESRKNSQLLSEAFNSLNPALLGMAYIDNTHDPTESNATVMICIDPGPVNTGVVIASVEFIYGEQQINVTVVPNAAFVSMIVPNVQADLVTLSNNAFIFVRHVLSKATDLYPSISSRTVVIERQYVGGKSATASVGMTLRLTQMAITSAFIGSFIRNIVEMDNRLSKRTIGHIYPNTFENKKNTTRTERKNNSVAFFNNQFGADLRSDHVSDAMFTGLAWIHSSWPHFKVNVKFEGYDRTISLTPQTIISNNTTMM
jgi:hypothetical protein